MNAIYKEVYPAIATLAKYNFRFAVRLCLRINRGAALQEVLSRENLLIANAADNRGVNK